MVPVAVAATVTVWAEVYVAPSAGEVIVAEVGGGTLTVRLTGADVVTALALLYALAVKTKDPLRGVQLQLNGADVSMQVKVVPR